LVNYKSGQVLLFHRSSRGAEKHEALTVERTEKSGIVARDQHGMERTVSPTQARSFSVHECQQIEVAPGDRLLLTGNRGAADFRATNGELVKVRDVDGGRIHLEDGRTLPVNYHEFDHGYAVTAHRSQGKTVDAVILSADAMKQELFYVGASRGRQEIVVVTSDREQLRNLLGVSTARPSATELAREQAQHHPAPMRSPERPPLQALEPPLLRKKDGHRRNLGMGR
jgi:ATP-dependent exoDNAse (exonuclease V) alpha subunit